MMEYALLVMLFRLHRVPVDSSEVLFDQDAVSSSQNRLYYRKVILV